MVNQGIMTTGFLLAGFIWTLWWNIDWRRFIKFYVPSGPPYRRWVEIVFRTFFAACSLGAASDLAKRLFQPTLPMRFYRDVVGVAMVWFAVIILMVKTVEYFASKRKPKISTPL
jgi:hypothetical protein